MNKQGFTPLKTNRTITIALIKNNRVRNFVFSDKKSLTGFTLLEVIVAMVVVVVGLILISQAFSIGLRAVRVSDKATVARFLAEQKIAELETQAFSTLQSTNGDFGTNYPGFTWQEEVTSTDLDNLKQVTLTISWTEDNTTRTLPITKLIANHGEETASS